MFCLIFFKNYDLKRLLMASRIFILRDVCYLEGRRGDVFDQTTRVHSQYWTSTFDDGIATGADHKSAQTPTIGTRVLAEPSRR